jgi:hypothetical protein
MYNIKTTNRGALKTYYFPSKETKDAFDRICNLIYHNYPCLLVLRPPEGNYFLKIEANSIQARFEYRKLLGAIGDYVIPGMRVSFHDWSILIESQDHPEVAPEMNEEEEIYCAW